MVVGSSLDKIFMVMEFFDTDVKSLVGKMKKKGEQMGTAEVKCLMKQLLQAIDHLHAKWYIHRDLKTSNLLYNSEGKLAVCDFGLARRFEDPIRHYTTNVVTLWYRCPELLLGIREYAANVDMWSVGCIMGELLLGEPLLPGKGEVDQISKIFHLLGAPTEERWPGFKSLPGGKNLKIKANAPSRLRGKFPVTSFSGGPYLSRAGFELLSGLLEYDPGKRMNSNQALEHAWFEENPLPRNLKDMPRPPK
mmetsp:Transcript_11210/g.16693  ORF Transcript_11210/g.16693 Transcript_11210/m.16693 type:complete len:249 (+) Transcript_11210:228-974(+)